MTDNTLQLLAKASSSDETRKNLDQLSRATKQHNDAADKSRAALVELNTQTEAAKQHLQSMADDIAKQQQEHQAAVQSDMDNIARHRKEVEEMFERAKQTNQEAESKLKSAAAIHAETDTRSAAMSKWERELTARQLDLDAKNKQTDELNAQLQSKLSKLQSIANS